MPGNPDPTTGVRQHLEAGAGSHGGHKEVSVEALPHSAVRKSRGLTEGG